MLSKLSYKQKVLTIIIAAILLVSAGFGGGFYYGKKQIPSIYKVNGLENKEMGKPQSVDFNLFWDVWSKVQQDYVKRNDLNYKDMVYGAIGGMVKGLNDPYSMFFPPQKSKQFLDDIKGNFEGIGAEIGLRKGVITIISPLKGSPAEKAGLRAGDQILKIGSKATDELTIDEAVSLIRGQRGTAVTLTIFRSSFDKPKETKIIRDVIKVPALDWKIINKDIAHIQIYSFSENLNDEFNKAAQEIVNGGAKKIILDLRNNPGGYLEVAQYVGSWFIKRGDVIAQEDFGDKKDFYRSFGYEALGNYPLVVLANEGSASASEIMAGALRDDKNTPLIGEKTFGKGTVQILENFSDGSSLKITIARWLTPKGISISEEGLKPDYEVKLSDDDIKNNKDPQLDKAIEVVNKIK